MLIMGFIALFAAFFAIMAVLVISSLRRHIRMRPVDVFEALVLGAKDTICPAIACAAVGFIVGAVGLSGIGLRFTQSIIGIADGQLLPALLLAALSSLFLSFDLPTTSVYIIAATLVTPNLVQMGVAPLVAHRFSYYWGGVSAITPPVALAAYVGAGIAGAPVMKPGFTAMRLGMAAYIVLFIFVHWPAPILWHEADPLRLLAAVGGGATAVVAMAALGDQWLTRALAWWKLALLASAIVLVMHPAALANVLAVTIVLGIALIEFRAGRHPPAHLPSSGNRP